MIIRMYPNKARHSKLCEFCILTEMAILVGMVILVDLVDLVILVNLLVYVLGDKYISLACWAPFWLVQVLQKSSQIQKYQKANTKISWETNIYLLPVDPAPFWLVQGAVSGQALTPVSRFYPPTSKYISPFSIPQKPTSKYIFTFFQFHKQTALL